MSTLFPNVLAYRVNRQLTKEFVIISPKANSVVVLPEATIQPMVWFVSFSVFIFLLFFFLTFLPAKNSKTDIYEFEYSMTHKLVSRTMTLISKMPETTAPGNHLQIINHRILTIKMSAYLHVSPLTLFNKQWPNRYLLWNQRQYQSTRTQ